MNAQPGFPAMVGKVMFPTRDGGVKEKEIWVAVDREAEVEIRERPESFLITVKVARP